MASISFPLDRMQYSNDRPTNELYCPSHRNAWVAWYFSQFECQILHKACISRNSTSHILVKDSIQWSFSLLKQWHMPTAVQHACWNTCIYSGFMDTFSSPLQCSVFSCSSKWVQFSSNNIFRICWENSVKSNIPNF